MSLAEDINIWPYDPSAPQEVHHLGFDYDGGDEIPAAYIVAEQDEFERGPASNSKVKMLTSGELQASYRLKDDVARKFGLLPRWTVGSSGESQGGGEGSKSFAQNYDPKSPIWTSYIPLQR